MFLNVPVGRAMNVGSRTGEMRRVSLGVLNVGILEAYLA